MSQQWQKLKEVFAQANPLNREERLRFLELLAAEKPELAHDLAVLLDDHSRLGDFLEAPVWHWLSQPEEPKPVTLVPGTMVDGYFVERLLGQGGMGTVYLARQETPVQRAVALKLLHVESRALDRFHLEQQILARLDHPNIARYYDAGITPDGVPYLAMEYVNGPPITEWCTGLSLRERLFLFLEVCDAVAFAHQCGVIHRDLKPANILVTRQGDRAQVKVIDFGISKDGVSARALTQTGGFLGTPDYVSPEQAGLINAPLSHGTDVYSLGVLLYGLLCGSLPFDLNNQPLMVLMKTLRHTLPAPPSARTSEQQSGLLWRDLDAVVLKALEKEPRFRYALVTDLASDLRRALTGRVVSAAKPDPVYRLRKFWGRHQRSLLASGAMLVLVLSLLGWGFWERRQADRAALFWNNYRVLEGDLETAYLLPLHNIGHQREQLRTYISTLETRLPHLIGRATTEAHHVLGRAYLTLDAWEEASQHLAIASRRAPANADIAAQMGLCRALLAQEQLTSAKQIRDSELRALEVSRVERTYVQKAISDLERARKLDPAPRAYLEAFYAFLKGDLQVALEHTQRAILLEPNHYRAFALLGRIHQARAAQFFRAKNMNAYLEAHQQAIAAYEKRLEIVRSFPTGYEELAQELFSFKKLTRGAALTDGPALIGRAEYLTGQGLRADPDNPRLLGLMVQIELEEVLDHYEHGDMNREPFDDLRDMALQILEAHPCEPGALKCVGQLGTYYARMEYPRMEAYTKLVEGAQAMEILLQEEPHIWSNYQGLATLYSFTVIAAAPHGLPTQPWLAKSLALTRLAGRYFPNTTAYHRTRASALHSYALQMNDVGADPTQVLDLALEEYFMVASRSLSDETERTSIAELYRVRAQTRLLTGEDPESDVHLALYFGGLFTGNDDDEGSLFNAGNALAARMSYRLKQGGNADEPFWQALGLYRHGMDRYPNNHRLYYGAAQLCLDRADSYRNQGDTTTADAWTCRALAFADAGQRNNPDYAGYPFIQAQAAARYGCKDQAFDYLEQALSGNPHCFGNLKHHWLFAHYQADPRMQDLEKRFPDQSASWRFEEL